MLHDQFCTEDNCATFPVYMHALGARLLVTTVGIATGSGEEHQQQILSDTHLVASSAHAQKEPDTWRKPIFPYLFIEKQRLIVKASKGSLSFGCLRIILFCSSAPCVKASLVYPVLLRCVLRLLPAIRTRNRQSINNNNKQQRRWAAVYEDEMEVLTGDSAARAAGVGRGGLFSNGAGGGGQPRTGNQGPPPKDKPGPGSFNGETFTGDSWDTSGASF